MNNMKFGVVIRSIGEQTEALVEQSVKAVLPDVEVFYVRNVSPAYNAYLEMFQIAKNNGFDWFLGLDADTVLKPDWYDKFVDTLAAQNTAKAFCIVYDVFDFITQRDMCRGNHFYNGSYVDDCIKYMKINAWLSRRSFLKTRIGKRLVNHTYYTKPESSLRNHFMRQDVCIIDEKASIGYHGFEQTDEENVRQMIVRYYRDTSYINRYYEKNAVIENPELLRQRELALYAFKNVSRYKAMKQVDYIETATLVEKIIADYNNQYPQNEATDVHVSASLEAFYKRVGLEKEGQ